MRTEKVFRTSDYKLAAYLRSRDIILEAHPNPRRPQKVEFTAPATEALYRAVAEFNSDEPVPVQTFIENIEAVKDEMMSVIRGGIVDCRRG